MTSENRTETSSGCEICHQPTNVLNIIPKHRPDGSLITLACTNCATEVDMFCAMHQRPHLGFEDGTSACRFCIDDGVDLRGDEIAKFFFNRVEESKKNKEIIAAVAEYYELVGGVTGESRYRIIARAIMTVSKRLNFTPEDVIEKTAEQGPHFLFPFSWVK